MHRLTVNLMFELNQMNLDKIMDRRVGFAPFYKNFLIKKMEILNECHCLNQYYYET